MNVDTKIVSVLDKEITPVVAKAGKVVIKNDADMKKATELLSQMNVYADTIAEKKEEITKPMNAALKAVRGLFKPLETKLDDAIGSVRKGMTVYQTEKVLKAREDEARIAARVGEGKGKIKIETAIKKLDQIEVPDTTVSGDSGSVTFVEIEKFEIVDIKKVPIEYHLVDETKVRGALKAGIKLEGVRYYTEMVPRNNR